MTAYTYETRDVTTIADGIILSGVNCQGVMGSGIAKAIYEKWPLVRVAYLDFVEKTNKLITSSDQLLGSTQAIIVSDNITVVNCFTQNYYGSDGKRYASPDAIRTCLAQVFDATDQLVDDNPIVKSFPYTVYMPPIGCGLGGLSWDTDVKPIIDDLYINRNFPLTIITN